MKSEKFASCTHYCRNQAIFQNENWSEFANFPEKVSNILDTSNNEQKNYKKYFLKKQHTKIMLQEKILELTISFNSSLYDVSSYTEKMEKFKEFSLRRIFRNFQLLYKIFTLKKQKFK